MLHPSLSRLLVLPAYPRQDSNVHGLVRGKEMDHSRDSFRNRIHFIVREQPLTPWKPISCGLILTHYLGLDSKHSYTRVSLRKKHIRDMESADWSTGYSCYFRIECSDFRNMMCQVGWLPGDACTSYCVFSSTNNKKPETNWGST